MKLKTLINKAIKLNPIPANIDVDGVAILFIDEYKTVLSLLANMDTTRLYEICEHILEKREDAHTITQTIGK